MGSSDHLVLLLLLLLYISVSANTQAVGCSDQVIAFSPCLQFISLSPNNRTSAPSSACCDVFSSAFRNRSAACLCYLVRQPLLLGFPLSTARILSLSSLCTLPKGAAVANVSLESFCSGSSTLPPLQAIIGPGIPRQPRFRNQHPSLESPPSPQSTTTSPPEDTDIDILPSEVNFSIITPSSSSFQPTHIRSAAKKIRNRSIVSFGLIISILVPISTLQIDTPLNLLFANQVAYQFSRIKQNGNK